MQLCQGLQGAGTAEELVEGQLVPVPRAFLCLPMKLANGGLLCARGRKVSARPPSQTSMSSGCLYRSQSGPEACVGEGGVQVGPHLRSGQLHNSLHAV